MPHNILEDNTELKGVYHSSKYAAESKAKTGTRIQEVLEKRRKELEKDTETGNALHNFKG